MFFFIADTDVIGLLELKVLHKAAVEISNCEIYKLSELIYIKQLFNVLCPFILLLAMQSWCLFCHGGVLTAWKFQCLSEITTHTPTYTTESNLQSVI